jgi:dienelactone hydrolase
MDMSGPSPGPVAIWFGSPDRPLAGFVHMPKGPSTGGVIICAPFGYEAVCAHRTLRQLAQRLADHGQLVLRFDYEGTGDSAGSGFEPDLLERWQSSVAAAAEELRRRGVPHPALVGVRLGAALACRAVASDADLGPLVLWAPVTSGKRYRQELRGQAAASAGGVLPDGSYNIFGYPLPPQLLQTLKTWQPLAGLDATRDLLLVQSPGWRDVGEAAADLATSGLHPRVLEGAGTTQLLERDAEMVDVPVQLVRDITDWLIAQPASLLDLPSQAPAADRVRVIAAEAGLVEEQLVTVGPTGLRAILSQPAGPPADDAVLFLNNGVAPAAGPGRCWVEFGRALAATGLRTLRLDFSGLGESPDTNPRATRPNPFPKTAALEVGAAVRYLRDVGARSVTVVGLCSGAQVAIRSAAYGERVDMVYAINASLLYPIDIGVGPWRRKVWTLVSFPLSKRPVIAVMYRLPERMWTVLDRLGLFPSPLRYLRLATDRGTQVRLTYSTGDPSRQDVQIRAGRGVDKLVTLGTVSLDELVGMDHSLFNREHRPGLLKSLAHSISASALEPEYGVGGTG